MKFSPFALYTYSALVLLITTGCKEEVPQSYTEAELIEIMGKQQDAWNNADIEGFMAWYENSGSLRFISSQGLMRGHQALKERYESAYPDPKTMGKLVFDVKEIIPLGEQHAYVIGSWTLLREDDHPEGYFTLLFSKTKDGWRIISDHTS